MLGKVFSNFFTSSGIVVFPLTGLGVIYVTENKVKIDTIIQSIKDGTFSLDSLKVLLNSELPEPEQKQETFENNSHGNGEEAPGEGAGATVSGENEETVAPKADESSIAAKKEEEKKPEAPKPKKEGKKKPKKDIDLETLISNLIAQWEENAKNEKDQTKKTNLTKGVAAFKTIQTFIQQAKKDMQASPSSTKSQ